MRLQSFKVAAESALWTGPIDCRVNLRKVSHWLLTLTCWLNQRTPALPLIAVHIILNVLKIILLISHLNIVCQIFMESILSIHFKSVLIDILESAHIYLHLVYLIYVLRVLSDYCNLARWITLGYLLPNFHLERKLSMMLDILLNLLFIALCSSNNIVMTNRDLKFGWFIHVRQVCTLCTLHHILSSLVVHLEFL